MLVAQSFLTLCNLMDWSLPGSFSHRILQARIGKWVAIPFSGDLPDPGIERGSAALLADSWPSELPGKPISHCKGSLQYRERNWLVSLRIHSRRLKMAPTFNIITNLPIHLIYPKDGFPRWLSSKESACQGRRLKRYRFIPCVGKIPWRRKWHSSSVFLLGVSHGQRNLVGYSSWGCKELDKVEYLSTSKGQGDACLLLDSSQRLASVCTEKICNTYVLTDLR